MRRASSADPSRVVHVRVETGGIVRIGQFFDSLQRPAKNLAEMVGPLSIDPRRERNWRSSNFLAVSDAAHLKRTTQSGCGTHRVEQGGSVCRVRACCLCRATSAGGPAASIPRSVRIDGKCARRERWRLLWVPLLSARTPKTITDPDKLIASLQKVRKDRCASVEDENIPGISSVGGPILDAWSAPRLLIRT
jgi:hypothetical protein